MKAVFPTGVRVRSTCCCLSCLLLCVALRASEWDIRINEILYHPLGGGDNGDLEFLELFNAGSSPVDLGGWFFTAGVDYTFPPGTVIEGGEYVVLSPNPGRAAEHYSLTRVEGPYRGRLDNGGEIVSLANARGRRVSEVHYRDEGPWPGTPDGLGPSLEFTEVDDREDLHIRWKRSLFIGGTPAARNSRSEVLPVSFSSRREVVSEGDLWRAFRGVRSPPGSATDWIRDDFDDRSWQESAGGFGYGSGHGFTYSTPIAGMRNQFTTFYIRRSFALDDPTLDALQVGENVAELVVSFDDGYIAYLNGVEVGRQNAGRAGVPATYDATAGTSRSGVDRIALDVGLLRTEDNILAIQGLNRALDSGDFFIGASLIVETLARPPAEPSAGDPLTRGILNEIEPVLQDGSPGFVELYNPDDELLRLGGFAIRTDRGEAYRIPPGVVLEPGAFLAMDTTDLAFDIPRGKGVYLLVGEDGKTLIDALEVDFTGEAVSFGRYPDGDDDTAVFVEPTPERPNALDTTSTVVINELYFHPPFVAPADGECAERCSDERQWIELWNYGEREVDLALWQLSGAVRFTFPAGTTIPAGGAVVVAADLEAFRREYPEAADVVVGQWSGRLQHDSEAVNLRDALGNLRDRVKYGDGKPWNDEEPADGADDRTFVAGWPTGADGEGASLELVHPRLENRLGVSWRASTAPGGTPGRVNSTFVEDPSPVVGSVKHRPVVPRSDQSVTISCRPHAVAPLARVTLEWALDGRGGAPNVLTMNDDGEQGDRRADDGIFSVEIPPQDDGSLLRWRFRVEDVNGRTAVSPSPPPVPPHRDFDGPFYLCEIDDTPLPANGASVIRILMTESDVEALGDRSPDSDVLLPATFIADGEVHYLVGLRYRGESSRREPNRSYRIDFPADDLFDGTEHLNLNGANGGGRLGRSAVAEILATDLYRRAGHPAPQAWAVNLHFPGEVERDFDPRYVRKENVDGDFLTRAFGEASDGGNLYRARNPGGTSEPSGDLAYLGEDPERYSALYEKKTNRDENDFGDLVALARAFDPVATPDDLFADTLDALIDADQWAGFFAVMSLLTNSDGGIWNTNGEDYFLYHVDVDSPRPDAGRWLILPWDLEETFVAARERLFRPDVASIRRFLSEPRFARRYYEQLLAVRQGPFSRAEMIEQFDFVRLMYPAEDVFDVVDPIDSFVATRLGFVDRTVASRLSAGPGLPTPETVLVSAFGDMWSLFRGRRTPPGESMAWSRRDYRDDEWERGRTGIGYGDGDDVTVLDDMEDEYTTVFVRGQFSIDDSREVDRLVLTIDYDDAFIAYVNGVEVARSANAPGQPGEAVTFDQTAEGSHEAGVLERFEFSPEGLELTIGENLLAIVGFNRSLDSSDFSLNMRLEFEKRAEEEFAEAGGCGGPVFAFGKRVFLRGLASPLGAQAVRVDGQLAEVSWITSGSSSYGLAWGAFVSVEPGENLVRVSAHPDPAGLLPAVDSVDLVVYRVDDPPTVVSGELQEDMAWSAAASPYRMTGDVTVPSGVTLTIEPGTVVLVENGSTIFVEGRIVAEGTADEPIVLNAYSCEEFGEGIVVRGTGRGEEAPTHILRHVQFSHGVSEAGAPGFVGAVDAKLVVEDCAFETIFADVIDVADSRLIVRASRFENVEEGVHCERSAVRIEECVFRRLLGDSDGIDFDATSERSVIASCLFDGCTDDGIDLGAADAEIRDNVFHGVEDKAISIEGNGPSGPSSLLGNLIYDCGTGMALKNGLRVEEGGHNTISRCRVGMDLFAKDDARDGGHGVFHSMIVWNNDLNVRLDERSSAELSFSDVGGEELWPGEGNVRTDPLFVDPDRGDFALLRDSPGVGTGRDGSDMGARGPSDGAFTFVRGDADGNGAVNINDPIRILSVLFEGGAQPACLDPLDANDDGEVNISDPLFLLGFLFSGGNEVPMPYPAAGVDPTVDDLPCETGL